MVSYGLAFCGFEVCPARCVACLPPECCVAGTRYRTNHEHSSPKTPTKVRRAAAPEGATHYHLCAEESRELALRLSAIEQRATARVSCFRYIGGAGMLRKVIAFAVATALFGLSAAAKPVLPRDGDYLSTAYIAALERMKSHKKAADMGAPQAITVSRDKLKLNLQLHVNWHEGDSAVFDLDKSTAQTVGSECFKKTFLPIDATHFNYQENKTASSYQFVGNALSYITEKLLVGNYVDDRGRTYIFGRDGKAQFPGRTFRYELYPDIVFDDDEFTDLDATKPEQLKNYGFAWRAGRLFIYNANCSDEHYAAGCLVDKKHPLAMLRRTGR